LAEVGKPPHPKHFLQYDTPLTWVFVVMRLGRFYARLQEKSVQTNMKFMLQYAHAKFVVFRTRKNFPYLS